MKVKILYRCGANWKTFFDHEINLNDHPEASKLVVGDEFEMGEYGTLSEDNFFGSDIHEHEYDDEYDHNILEITEIL